MSRECADCDSTGYRYVQRPYAEAEARKRMPPEEQLADGPERQRRYEVLVATHLNTVYPCRTCNAALFFRWAGGHLDPSHNRDGCGECIEDGSGRGRGRGAPRKQFTVGPPPPQEPPEPGWDDLERERETSPATAEPEPDPLPLDHAMRAAGSD